MKVNKIFIIINLMNIKMTRGQTSRYIFGRNFSRIEDFVYTAFLNIECHINRHSHYYKCGSSIVNQAILLTAAHCFEGCKPTTNILAHTGSEYRHMGNVHVAIKFKIHKEYSPHPITNDIALVKLKSPLKFGKYVQRISFIPKPPYFEPAVVAGFDVDDDLRMNSSRWLKHDSQKILLWTCQACIGVMPNLPAGVFCAAPLNEPDHPRRGDSGNPLVVREYIQIGLLSFRNPKVSHNLVFYTDIGYFYYWIYNETQNLYCSEKT